jgi:uncharacterized membrane protein
LNKIINYLRPLIEDSNGKISMGRVAFWIAFGISMRQLYLTRDLPGNVIGLITCLLAYSIGKVFIGKKYNSQDNGTQQDQDNSSPLPRPSQGIENN